MAPSAPPQPPGFIVIGTLSSNVTSWTDRRENKRKDEMETGDREAVGGNGNALLDLSDENKQFMYVL
ncbi:hypothetical protein P171DRAFT_480389 [Karstenula rhodostoma CBS 690.94]|uniref:Uncharacterized protein n=1 Tax=Karstenula rhodostoma CBS 690.94 TaxID=1392251 RepID=A0A9P4PS73_9PLEO|nr:hypothetical protein P171DRAFT_480389 [Karstenula rhodostoma CBS 690.94]